MGGRLSRRATHRSARRSATRRVAPQPARPDRPFPPNPAQALAVETLRLLALTANNQFGTEFRLDSLDSEEEQKDEEKCQMFFDVISRCLAEDSQALTENASGSSETIYKTANSEEPALVECQPAVSPAKLPLQKVLDKNGNPTVGSICPQYLHKHCNKPLKIFMTLAPTRSLLESEPKECSLDSLHHLSLLLGTNTREGTNFSSVALCEHYRLDRKKKQRQDGRLNALRTLLVLHDLSNNKLLLKGEDFLLSLHSSSPEVGVASEGWPQDQPITGYYKRAPREECPHGMLWFCRVQPANVISNGSARPSVDRE